MGAEFLCEGVMSVSVLILMNGLFMSWNAHCVKLKEPLPEM